MEKPYEFRELCSKDIFPMFKILNKIGFKEFKNCFSSEDMKKAITEKSNVNEVGMIVLLDIAGIIIQNIGTCEDDIYEMLSSVSNLNKKQIQNLGMADFGEMITDFIQKPEFKDFFKVVSKLFK